MNRVFIALLACQVSLSALSQQGPYVFRSVAGMPAAPVENQCATGTCWSFATMSFLEAEIFRLTGTRVDLSEMINVRVIYPRKAESYIHFQGKQQFGPGGLSHDVLRVVSEYGIVPEEAYPGLPGGGEFHDHGSLDAMLESLVRRVVEGKLNTGEEWRKAVEAILDATLGAPPSGFEYGGKRYSPATFRDEMKIRPSDYVGLTSFMHEPWYNQIIVEVPDNWARDRYYNIPMDELVQATREAVRRGFTVAWDADVSEDAFSFPHGIALIPADTVARQAWQKRRVTEMSPDPAARQQMYESYATTDDHLMHLTGLAEDQAGKPFFMVRNSWGAHNPYGGYQYVSEPYFYFKTICVYVHRDALPESLKKKLGW